MDEIKRIFSNVFPRDIRTVEPSKKGLVLGESLRIYDEGKGGVLLRFLRGTENRVRKTYTDKLETNGITYKVGDDFEQ